MNRAATRVAHLVPYRSASPLVTSLENSSPSSMPRVHVANLLTPQKYVLSELDSPIACLAFPKRFASFVLRLFSSDSNVLELPIIHLQQLSPLQVANTAQSVGCSEATEDRQKRIWHRSSIFGMQLSAGCGRGFGDLVQSFTGFYRTPRNRIGLFLSLHAILLVWLT